MPPLVPKNELELRVNNLQSKLKSSSTDAVILPLGIYFEYFFGKSAKPSERIIAGVISQDEDPFILTPSFEVSNIKRSTYVEDVIGWEETESPYKLLAKEFEDRDIGENIATDPKFWIHEIEKIQKYGDKNLYSGHEILSSQRLVKTDWEVDQLKAAARASADGILAALPQIREGMTEKGFVPILAKELGNRSGNPLSFCIVQFAENSAIPHGMPTDKKLKNNSVILIDAGTSVNGYQGDITITVPFGKPEGYHEIYDIVYEANRAALNADKPGIVAADLDKVARNYITEKGYGEYFTHRLGHGIGMEVHEDPYIVGSNQNKLETKNCHTIEPGIYQEGKFGVRIEDDVIITKNGAELLYDTPRKNFDII